MFFKDNVCIAEKQNNDQTIVASIVQQGRKANSKYEFLIQLPRHFEPITRSRVADEFSTDLNESRQRKIVTYESFADFLGNLPVLVGKDPLHSLSTSESELISSSMFLIVLYLMHRIFCFNQRSKKKDNKNGANCL